jgi:hypothetical protein
MMPAGATLRADITFFWGKEGLPGIISWISLPAQSPYPAASAS